MMTINRRTWVVLSIMAFVAGFVVTINFVAMASINEWNDAEIIVGMTQADVERTLSRPATRTEKVAYQPSKYDPAATPGIIVTTSQSWVGHAMTIRVGFVKEGTVAYVESFGKNKTIVQRLRRWVGLDPPAMGAYRPPGSTAETIPD